MKHVSNRKLFSLSTMQAEQIVVYTVYISGEQDTVILIVKFKLLLKQLVGINFTNMFWFPGRRWKAQ
jgi:hypothetical protein